MIRVSVLFPVLGLLCFVVYKLFKKPLKRAFVKIKEKLPQVKCCSGCKDDGVRDNLKEQENTELYTLEEDQTLA